MSWMPLPIKSSIGLNNVDMLLSHWNWILISTWHAHPKTRVRIIIGFKTFPVSVSLLVLDPIFLFASNTSQPMLMVARCGSILVVRMISCVTFSMKVSRDSGQPIVKPLSFRSLLPATHSPFIIHGSSFIVCIWSFKSSTILSHRFTCKIKKKSKCLSLILACKWVIETKYHGIGSV